ncbi:MAG: terminase small subunit [Desulfuromonadaceae bacterium]|nr:terminase small subunit [Desulfuromonadaceae bacterium]
MRDLTAKQIKFCESYILSRDAKQSSLNAGYSESYSKSKAYELLQDEKIKEKIKQLETDHNQNHFKRLAIVANKELENILLSSDNDSTKLRAIELIYKLSGVIRDDKISLNINNTNKSQTNTKSLDDFYDDIKIQRVVIDTLEDFEKEY